MPDSTPCTPPKVWTWKQANGGCFANGRPEYPTNATAQVTSTPKRKQITGSQMITPDHGLPPTGG